MDDHPALGEFRKTFAGEFGTIDEFPLPAADGRPGFMGATEIISTNDLWTRWLAGPENRIDSRAFLRARALDLWLDNYDDHRGQWRWIRIPGRELFQPLSEDPDMVLVHHDGMLSRGLRGPIPKLLKFTAEYPGKLEGPLQNSFEVDRWLLSDLDAAAWQEVAKDLQGRLTDDVIDHALRQMPLPWYAIDGADKLAALKTRRAGLVDYILSVYRFYAKEVDVHATDAAELVTVARGAGDAVEITIARADGSASPWFRRLFLANETDEVRIYLHGGNDRVTRSGPAGGPVHVRVIVGGGQDLVDDSKSGGTDVWTDKGTVDVTRGDGTQVRRNVWTNPAPVKDAPWLEPRSYGHRTTGGAIFAYHPDIEFVLGYGLTRTAWGFRTQPAASVQSLRAGIATGEGTGKIEYEGTFRRIGSGLSFRFETFASDIEQFNFFGYGNDSSYDPELMLPYRAEQKVLFARPTARFDLGRRLEAFLGPEVRYSDTPTTYDTIIGSTTPYGIGKFGQAAIRGGFHFDSRKRPDTWSSGNITESVTSTQNEERVNGINLQASGFFAPEGWDVTGNYGGADGVVAGYVGTKRAHLAVRVGGRKLWGDAPWFEAAHIGGSNDRGFRSHRFIGNSSLFGTASLRAWLGRLPIPLLPARIGVVGFVDTGRVWLENEDSDTWHTSLGGGLLLQPVSAPITVHAVAANSKEGTRFYFGLGYPF